MRRKFGMFTVPNRKLLLLNPRSWMVINIFFDILFGKASTLDRSIGDPYHNSNSPPDPAFYVRTPDFRADYTDIADLYPSFWNPFDTDFRNPRNAPDQSAEFLNHTTIIAHIANGIALQAGLMDGKIQIDDVIGELLSFGSVQASDVAKFKSDKISEFSSKLKSIPGALDKGVEDLEAQALAWNKWLADASAFKDMDFKTIPRASEYFADVKTLQSVDFGLVQDVLKSAKKLKSVFQPVDAFLNGANSSGDEDVQAYRALKDLKTHANKVSSNLKLLIPIVKGINEYKTLPDGPTVFVPLETMVHLMQLRNTGAKTDTEGTKVASIKKNLKGVVESVATAQASLQDTSLIKEMTAANSASKTKEVTAGFLNGIPDLKQLEKDVRSPWLESIFNVKGPQMNPLNDGLLPLFKVHNQLNDLANKLKPVSSIDLGRPLASFADVQSGISTLSQSSIDSVSVMSKFDTCNSEAKTTQPVYGNVETFVTDVKSLKNKLAILTSAVLESDGVAFETDVNSFIAALGFPNFDNEDASAKHLATKIDELKSGDKLANIKQRVKNVAEKFDEVEGDVLKKHIDDNVAKGNGVIAEQKFLAGVNSEKKVQKCLEGHSETSKKVTEAMRVLQKLRKLDPKDVDDVETAASTISDVAESFANIETIPDTLKKDVKEVTTDINKIPDPVKTSKAIGQSVTSLHHAYTLKEMEPQISQLKSSGATVAAEILKIVDIEKRKVLDAQWGDHKTNIEELEKTIAEIKTFDSKLDLSNAKTLKAYGEALKDLATIPDSKIVSNEKLKVLEVLIGQPKTDPKVKSELEESKKTLEKLATLDLEFSNHQTQFQSAPDAFQTVHDFLTQFLAVKRKDVVVVDEASNTWYIALGCLGGLLLLAIIIGLIYYCLNKHDARVADECRRNARVDGEREKEDAEAKYLMEWIDGRDYTSKEAADEVHGKVLEAMKEQVNTKSPYRFQLSTTKHRYWADTVEDQIRCNPRTMVQVKSRKFLRGGIKVHANWIKTAKGKEFIATQGPMTKAENKKGVTDDDFWTMIVELGVKAIVMLCNFKEMNAKGKLISKCGEYFAVEADGEVVCGRYTIVTKSKTETIRGEVFERVLEVKEKGKVVATVTHHHYQAWPDHGVPSSHTAALHIMNRVKDTEAPIVVHCSAGIGRTGSFIGLQYVYEDVVRDPKVVYCDSCIAIRDCRWKAIQNIAQSRWLEAGVVLMLKDGQRFFVNEAERNKIDRIYHKLMGDVTAEAPVAAPASTAPPPKPAEVQVVNEAQ